LRLERIAVPIVGESVVSSRLVETGVVSGLFVQIRVTVLPDRRVTVQFINVPRGVVGVRRLPKVTQVVVVGIGIRRIGINVRTNEHGENNIVVGDGLGSDSDFLSVSLIEGPVFGRTVILSLTLVVRVHVTNSEWGLKLTGGGTFVYDRLRVFHTPRVIRSHAFLLVKSSTEFIALALTRHTVCSISWHITVLIRQ
jgi:hypothetical protein